MHPKVYTCHCLIWRKLIWQHVNTPASVSSKSLWVSSEYVWERLFVCFSVCTREKESEKRSEARRGEARRYLPASGPSTLLSPLGPLCCSEPLFVLLLAPAEAEAGLSRTASEAPRQLSNAPSHKPHLKQICKINNEYFYNVFVAVFDLQKLWSVLAGGGRG